MQLDPGSVAIIGTFLAAQTGALIYFAGIVTRTLRDHDKAIDETRADCKQCRADVLTLKAERG